MMTLLERKLAEIRERAKPRKLAGGSTEILVNSTYPGDPIKVALCDMVEEVRKHLSVYCDTFNKTTAEQIMDLLDTRLLKKLENL